MHEAQSPQADPNASDRTHHYVAPPPARCHSCTAVAIRVSEYSGDDVRHPGALRFRSERVDDDQ